MVSPSTTPAEGEAGRQPEGRGYGLVLFASILMVVVGLLSAYASRANLEAP